MKFSGFTPNRHLMLNPHAREQSRLLATMTIAVIAMYSPSILAATTGTAFLPFYNFIYDAATGYLGRGISLAGGLVCLAIGAGGGKFVIAAGGILLAIFGALGPEIVNNLFSSSII